jgi:hypothetical protein
MPAYLALQLLSTFLGLSLLLWVYDRWMKAAGFSAVGLAETIVEILLMAGDPGCVLHCGND